MRSSTTNEGDGRMRQGAKPAVIFASMPVSGELRRLIPPGAAIITADAGWKNAAALGLEIDLAVGDFDSSTPPTTAKELICLPAEKDDTDTHYATRLAVERGYNDILLLGAMGGRPDHAHGNLQTLLWLAMQGVKATMADEENIIRCFGPGQHTVPATDGKWLSVFAAGGTTRGVYLRGVKYRLDNATLPPEQPIGVSNEFAADEAGIESIWVGDHLIDRLG